MTSVPGASLLLLVLLLVLPGPGAGLRRAAALTLTLTLLFLLAGAAESVCVGLLGRFVLFRRRRFIQRLAEQLLAVVLHLLGDRPAGLDALAAALQLVLVTHHLHLYLSRVQNKTS